jgi:phage shock protein A
MQKPLIKAMTRINSTIGEGMPTFEESRRKIDERRTRAKSMAEITGDAVDVRVFEVEQAPMRAEAQARLPQLRPELGLGAWSDESPQGEREAPRW